LVKNKNSGGKIKIPVKNWNFDQKSESWPKIKILVKNQNYWQNRFFCPIFDNRPSGS